MNLTLVLARGWGLALIFLGVIAIARRHYLLSVYPVIVPERLTRILFSAFALIGGLLLAVYDTLWQTLPSTLISLIGWIVAAEALMYLALPDQQLAKLIGIINKPPAYIAAGLVAIAIGAYLAIVGFGLLY